MGAGARRARALPVRARPALGYAALLVSVGSALPLLDAPPARAAAGSRPAMCATVGAGWTGTAVSALQRLLHVRPDGGLGAQTVTALRGFQQAHHLPATGALDGGTWPVLGATTVGALCAAQATPPHPVGPASCPPLLGGEHGPRVRAVQRAVGIHGDDTLGPATTRAVAAVQRRTGLPATGSVNGATWVVLGLAGTPACPAAASLLVPPGANAPAVPPSPAAPAPAAPSPAAATPPPAPAGAAVPAGAPVPASAVVAGTVAALSSRAEVADPLVTPLLRFAQAQLGKPYVYGGVGPDAYDCSGLVQASYAAAGIALPRVADDQHLSTALVALDQVQPGDILSYASDPSNPSTIYHDTLYLGRGQMIEAPKPGVPVRVTPVRVTDLVPLADRPLRLLNLPIGPGSDAFSIRSLQTLLARRGPLAVDGGFGPQTARALVAAQTGLGLPATGLADRGTWLALLG